MKRIEPMKTVCHTENSGMCYPEVTPGANAWVWSDQPNPKGDGTVRVTEHGLRRLLRIAAKAWPVVSYLAHAKCPEMQECYVRDVEPKKLAALLNELSSIFCEGDLVMSRLLVTPNGEAIRHKDHEVDEKGIPPWEVF